MRCSLYPFYSICFADVVSWVDRPAASSSWLLNSGSREGFGLENFKEPLGENTERTDLAVGSQHHGPKSIKVIALLKLLTWFVIFAEKH